MLLAQKARAGLQRDETDEEFRGLLCPFGSSGPHSRSIRPASPVEIATAQRGHVEGLRRSGQETLRASRYRILVNHLCKCEAGNLEIVATAPWSTTVSLYLFKYHSAEARKGGKFFLTELRQDTLEGRIFAGTLPLKSGEFIVIPFGAPFKQ